MKRVLFLCTGNYYRSRFAEALFNQLAQEAGLAWQADSCGLRVREESGNVGPISRHAVAGLGERGLPLPAERMPRQVVEADFAGADLVIAVKEAEHRKMMGEKFPAWAERVRYWHVHDLDAALPAEALLELEGLVRGLVAEIMNDK